MLYKTRGVVLSYIKYKETSVIVKIYTERFGMQSYIVNSVRTANSKTNKMSFLQPLVIVDLVVYHKPNIDIHRISEIKPAYIYSTLHTNIKKITVTAFITEVLVKCLKEQEQNEAKYKFIQDALIAFDHLENDSFHLQFLIELSAFLGFYPTSTHEFFEQLIQHQCVGEQAAQSLASDFSKLLSLNVNQSLYLESITRSKLLSLIVNFYELHIQDFGELKSLKILREI
jgi:DNA repair protein RecO (recombination protein O)